MKSEKEMKIMQEGGKRLRDVLTTLLAKTVPGNTGMEIDHLAEQLLRSSGGSPSFQLVPGYRWSTCICVNDKVVHGIPNDQPFSEGDIIGIDVGMYYQGYHTDAASSKIIGHIQEEKERETITTFLRTGEIALEKAIREARAGNRIGNISQAIQQEIEDAGYSVVKSLVGHGVGKKLHEQPEIPGYLKSTIDNTPILTPGMTLAIEVIYAQGKPELRYDSDGWTIRTKDHSLAGLFEKTIAIYEKETVVLT